LRKIATILQVTGGEPFRDEAQGFGDREFGELGWIEVQPGRIGVRRDDGGEELRLGRVAGVSTVITSDVMTSLTTAFTSPRLLRRGSELP
jgi:hypothetical protein